jgi:glyoxylase-like metal-dependent hydrolase (beta-lactamase superfamily II)
MFGAAEGQAVVMRQPADPEQERAAARAMLACPTGSIGVTGAKPETRGLFPQLLEDDVYYCGFNSEKSFGANAYFVRRRAGNLLVDAPRFTAALVGAFAAQGGLAHVLLTHRDDVADADRYAQRFGARVWIHEHDAAAAPFASDLLRGLDPTLVTPSLLAIPAPGHTRGSSVFLLEQRFLFTGDSLYRSRRRGRLSAFRDATWYSWDEQARSLSRLAAHSFEWVLPGHGDRGKAAPEEWRRQLLELVDEMRRGRGEAAGW